MLFYWLLCSLEFLVSCDLLVGVPRETQEEKDFADFDIFDDPDTPFSTFNFQYSNDAFNRLHDLMEFNTLNNLDVCIPFDSEERYMLRGCF